jgi:hypothetical protein
VSKLLKIELPTRSKPGKQNFDIRGRKVEQWIESLPMANLGETARLIYAVLTETNSLNYPHHQRYLFLEALREPVKYVCESMKKHFVGVTFPLPEKNQKIAAATREILSAMAMAYKIAAADLIKNNLLFPDKKLLATLVHRAITYSSKVLLTSYQVYAPYPKNAWYELHQLYRFAEKHKINKLSIADEQHYYVAKSSIGDEYTRALLLSLTSPYHLRLGEVGKVYDSLERWTSHCVLKAFENIEAQTDNNYFLTSLNQDRAPYSLSLHAVNIDNENKPEIRVLDTAKLSELIRDEIRNTEDVVTTTLTGIDMSRPNLSHDLLKRLLIAWGVINKRHFPRSDKQEKVQITLGLSATHEFISQRRNNKATMDQPSSRKDSYDNRAHYDSSVVKDLNEEQPDVWNMVYPNSETLNYEFPEDKARQQLTPIKTPEPAQPPKPRYQVDNWVILNESANGYCIERVGGDNATVQVGELIGIKRGGNGKSWKWGIGVIRWMKFNADNNLQVGIEMMNPDAAAIGLRSTASADNFQRTLMLPELSAISQPATLITSPVPWREGHQVTLKILGKEMPITLTKSLQNTGHFAQFLFDIHDQNKQTDNSGNNDWLNDKDFNNVWSSI